MTIAKQSIPQQLKGTVAARQKQYFQRPKKVEYCNMHQMAENYVIQTTCILELNSRLMDLFQTMDFLGKMKILEVGIIDFYRVGSRTAD